MKNYLKTIFTIAAVFVVVSVSIPLGVTFDADFGFETLEGVGACNVFIQPEKEKAVKVSYKLYSYNLCQYCLKIQYEEIVGVYPIYSRIFSVNEYADALLTISAFQDFADPDVVDTIYSANFTFVNCVTLDDSTILPSKPTVSASITTTPTTLINDTFSNSSISTLAYVSTTITNRVESATTATMINTSAIVSANYYFIFYFYFLFYTFLKNNI